MKAAASAGRLGSARRRWCAGVGVLLAGLGFGVGPANAADDVSGKGGGARDLPPLDVRIDPDQVDLERGRLVVAASRPIARVTLKVLDASGAVLAQSDQSYVGEQRRTSVTVRWDASRGKAARIEVFAYDADEYYKGLALTPWSFEVPHEEVVFATDSAEIRPSEEPKLRASAALIREALERHRELGPIRLFVAGHTDTRGSQEHNRVLSEKRARAIALWFKKSGLALPIAYQGFGESALKVVTADEVDEERNRRVDYVLAIEPPRFKVSGRAPAWRSL